MVRAKGGGRVAMSFAKVDEPAFELWRVVEMAFVERDKRGSGDNESDCESDEKFVPGCPGFVAKAISVSIMADDSDNG